MAAGKEGGQGAFRSCLFPLPFFALTLPFPRGCAAFGKMLLELVNPGIETACAGRHGPALHAAPSHRTSLLKRPCQSTFPRLVLREVCW